MAASETTDNAITAPVGKMLISESHSQQISKIICLTSQSFEGPIF